MREQLDRLIEEMIDKGIRFADAHREFERRFITRVLVRANGNLSRAMNKSTLRNASAASRLSIPAMRATK